MKLFELGALLISLVLIIVETISIITKFSISRKKNKIKSLRIKNISIEISKDTSLRNYGSLKNDFNDFQDPEDFKIQNSGRDLCNNNKLNKINIVDYCNHINLW